VPSIAKTNETHRPGPEAALKPAAKTLPAQQNRWSTPQGHAVNKILALASLTLALVGAPALAQSAAPQVKDFDLFVDMPTGFAFIKMPAGWKFVGKLEGDQLRNLPASTLTSLLPPDEDDVRTAHPAVKPAPRKTEVAVQG
jgi:hypothetical protein